MGTDQGTGYTGEMSAGEQTDQSSIWKIMVGVFTSPTEAFTAFNRSPRLIAVILVIFALGLITNYFTTEYSAQMQYDMVSQSTIIPPQQLEQMKEEAANPNRVTGALFAAIGQFIGMILISLVAWGLGSFVMGGDSTFKKVWGATLLGGLIPMVGGIVKLPLMMARESMYVSFGLAALFPEKDFTSIFYSILFYFDAFMIWGLIVTGIGYGIIFNISKGKGITVALILDIIFVGIMIGLVTLGMSFAGVEVTFF